MDMDLSEGMYDQSMATPAFAVPGVDPASNNRPLEFGRNHTRMLDLNLPPPPPPARANQNNLMRGKGILTHPAVNASIAALANQHVRNDVPMRTSSQFADNSVNPMNSGNIWDNQVPMMGGPMMMNPMVDQYSAMIANYAGYNMPGAMGDMNNVAMFPKFGLFDVIDCGSCIVYPPPGGTPSRQTRERPRGCKTVFVGGLPEKITVEILEDIFEKCGVIDGIRLGKKNFCHIRFAAMEMVDNAVLLSGYRIKIGDQSDPESTGRIHVDFAEARDDLHEWECYQRSLEREERHRDRLLDLLEPHSPHLRAYNDREAQDISEKLKLEDSFASAVSYLIYWLQRGEVNNRNSPRFFGMIQSVFSQIKRIIESKDKSYEDMEASRLSYVSKLKWYDDQLTNVDQVFTAALAKKCYDHMTKAQRKNIMTWKQQFQTAKSLMVSHPYEIDSAIEDNIKTEDMDLTGCEDINIKKIKLEPLTLEEQASEWAKMSGVQRGEEKPDTADSSDTVTVLKQKNSILESEERQLRNELELLKQEARSGEEKDIQIQALQATLRGAQKQLIEHQRKSKFKNTESTERSAADGESKQLSNQVDALLVGLISIFLNIHPGGSNISCIQAYVLKYMAADESVVATYTESSIEALMVTMPDVFFCKTAVDGSTPEKRWTFIGFKEIC